MTIFDILHRPNHIHEHKLQALLVNLDVKKAFDSVHWRLLYEVLERYGCQENFIKGIISIYDNPSA